MQVKEIPAPKIRYVYIPTEQKPQRELTELEEAQEKAQILKGDSREANGFFAGEIIEIE